MPRLRVLAGPSYEDLSPVNVNSGEAVLIQSDAFEGKVSVYIKGYVDASGAVGDSPYFKKRSDATWSIQMQGRFLHRYSADDILFGNTFARPLKLPWGFSAALKFMSFIDPTLEQDLASHTKPWALSPLIATMPYLEHRRTDNKEGGGTRASAPPFPPERLIGNDMSQLPLTASGGGTDDKKAKALAKNRRAYFQDAAHRQEVMFGPEDLLTADFCYDYLRFSADGVDLRLPGGISIDMMKYWDGQPVRFVCCERARGGTGADPWGRVLWCVVIEPVEDEGALDGKEL
ncbi:DUF1769-domain-containing protein [Wolfiporia cocos MD-104 SS10]|uniref:DUF1769-domain-containing protein n=1 Tax=Wolfiporia cocos (strain MD-104) TaxID=742152 RepID=A0A2H3J154_WOLCO|nr:DUF1769-domain-containing protein [Wolfiporia cocos MD-104 SS10]